MSVKLNKILESMEAFKLDSDVALLENTDLDPLTVAQAKKSIHESHSFIKGQLIHGGILKEAQDMLANAWTQAILEDISMEDVHNLGNRVANGAQNIVTNDNSAALSDAAKAAAIGAGALGTGALVVGAANKVRRAAPRKLPAPVAQPVPQA